MNRVKSKFSLIYLPDAVTLGALSLAVVSNKRLLWITIATNIVGKVSLGIYPLRNDGRCRWLTVDIDQDDMGRT